MSRAVLRSIVHNAAAVLWLSANSWCTWKVKGVPEHSHTAKF